MDKKIEDLTKRAKEEKAKTEKLQKAVDEKLHEKDPEAFIKVLEETC